MKLEPFITRIALAQRRGIIAALFAHSALIGVVTLAITLALLALLRARASGTTARRSWGARGCRAAALVWRPQRRQCGNSAQSVHRFGFLIGADYYSPSVSIHV